jgi:hypothetical protein
MVPEPRRIKYSEFKEIKDDNMAGAWNSWQRKKTVGNSIIKLLKIDAYRAINQVIVNKLKPIFNIRPMDVELIFDEESQKYGVFIKWEEAFCHIGKATAWMSDTENMFELGRIVLFDAVIGNNDRMVTNVLFLKNYKILGIDEGECFRFYAPIKCKFKKSIKDKLTAFVQKHRKYFINYAIGISSVELSTLITDRVPETVSLDALNSSCNNAPNYLEELFGVK